jgi:uncharacterized membrane protein YkoI
MPLPGWAAAVVLLAATACASTAPRAGITRDRAIAIAVTQVKWTPFDVAAVRATANNGRPVWRVTLKGRLPGQPPLLFETAIVDLDARTGEILSLSKT